jgi:ribosomal protein S18 acetylase RimI-like enzyme
MKCQFGRKDMENIIKINDSRIITNILNRSFMTVAKKYNFTKENAPTFPAFIDYGVIENQLKNGLKMYGYYIDGQIAGCAGYSSYKDPIYLIERLATLPEYRHSGIGENLMGFVENKIVEDGGKTAEIHVVDINEILIEWYKKLGYFNVRIEEIKTLPFDLYVMNKKLIESTTPP